MSEWTGHEQKPSQDHDLLIKIDANLENFMARFEEHTQDDKQNFSNLYKRTGNLQKYLWMATGALAAVELALKVFK